MGPVIAKAIDSGAGDAIWIETVRAARTHRPPTDEFPGGARSYLQIPTHVTDPKELGAHDSR
jgi:hypothetical protein